MNDGLLFSAADLTSQPDCLMAAGREFPMLDQRLASDRIEVARLSSERLYGRVACGAVFSRCGHYRYALWRVWHELRSPARRPNLLGFCGLNPSTATELELDPTISRCMGYARQWGHDGLLMLNLFGLRSTDPGGLIRSPDPAGPLLLDTLARYGAICRDIVCCWGSPPLRWRPRLQWQSHVENVLERLRGSADAPLSHARPRLLCLGQNRDHEPKHPLYLKGDLLPTRYTR